MASEEQLLLQCTENTSQSFKMPNYSIVWERSYCRSIAANHARNHNDQLLRVDTFLLHCLAFCALLALLWDCHTQLIMPKSPYTSCCFASSVKLLFGSGSHPSQSVFIVKPRSKSAVIKYHRALIWFWWFLKVLVFPFFWTLESLTYHQHQGKQTFWIPQRRCEREYQN